MFIERFMDRIRASNTYGEPIVNFNEDSVTKQDLKQALEDQSTKIQRKIKDVKRASSDAEPLIQDTREDVSMLKDLFKKLETKVDKI